MATRKPTPTRGLYLWKINHEYQDVPGINDALFSRLLQAKEQGDDDAVNNLKNEIIQVNVGLVRYQVYRMFNGAPARIADLFHITVDDLHEAGLFGLYKAMESYSPERGRFPTYASVIIDNELRMVPRYHNSPIRATGKTLSLDIAPADEDEDTGMHEYLGYDDNRYQLIEDRLLLNKLLTIVSAREFRVLYLYFVEEKTIYTIGEELHLSPPSISRIKKTALEKMKEHYGSKREVALEGRF